MLAQTVGDNGQIQGPFTEDSQRHKKGMHKIFETFPGLQIPDVTRKLSQLTVVLYNVHVQ